MKTKTSKWIAVLLAALVVTGACGDDNNGSTGAAGGSSSPSVTEESPSPQPSPDETTSDDTVTYEVWFHQGEKLFVTRRTETATTPAVGRASVEALLAGPSDVEADGDVESQVPDGTELLGLTIEDGTATVDMSEEYESGGGSLSMEMRLAQLVYTLTQFDTVDNVVLEIEGEEVTTFSGEGIVIDKPMTRKRFNDLLPLILVESPLIGTTVSSPVTVSGTANVFEATVSLRVLDSKGREIGSSFTTATCGTGCRGTYSGEIEFSVQKSQPGVVEAFESSAKDGSAVNVVSIPVTLEP